jgi:hypothetical protein
MLCPPVRQAGPAQMLGDALPIQANTHPTQPSF